MVRGIIGLISVPIPWQGPLSRQFPLVFWYVTEVNEDRHLWLCWKECIVRIRSLFQGYASWDHQEQRGEDVHTTPVRGHCDNLMTDKAY